MHRSFDNSLRVLVTGATGIAGYHVAQTLETQGISVLRASRHAREGEYTADISDPAAVQRLPNFEGVVHCAGLTPRTGTTTWAEFHQTNVVGSTVLAQEAAKRKVAFFVNISTAGGIGGRHSSVATRLYVISKYLAERRIREALRDRVPAISLRTASLYGERDRGSMSRLIQSVSRGTFLTPARGSVPKCLLYAGALAGVAVREVFSDELRGWSTRSIADLSSYTLSEIVLAIEQVVGRRSRWIPVSPSVMSLGIRPTELAGRVLRSSRIVNLAHGARIALTPVQCRSDNLLNEHPGLAVALTDGLRREVEWLRASRLL